MKKIDAVFGLVLLVSLLLYIFGWDLVFYEEAQLGMLILGILVGCFIIIRHPKSNKRTAFIVVGLMVGNWGILSNFLHAAYWMIFGFV
ncbi:hypothetical protein KBW71_28075 [Hydrogenophaga aromaticivorans]|uniref:hypothetical protein n=1 Tax=Hydrogenophaga aromaticivorans TaxID=2610898 RepID=UPI001B3818FA|nr:hypothetical protein [Hydrogenophaga aromaticivorans]MBQ0922300.1 hypothetical protein [Hydrogenophaga aromaticivorans]